MSFWDAVIIVLAGIPASIGVGVGITLGKDLYEWIKKKMKERKEKVYEDFKLMIKNETIK